MTILISKIASPPNSSCRFGARVLTLCKAPMMWRNLSPRGYPSLCSKLFWANSRVKMPLMATPYSCHHRKEEEKGIVAVTIGPIYTRTSSSCPSAEPGGLPSNPARPLPSLIFCKLKPIFFRKPYSVRSTRTTSRAVVLIFVQDDPLYFPRIHTFCEKLSHLTR